ncbi:MAG TPA: RNA-binding protein [Clostridiales bacterium]|nr:RNA-binding protein [Clostridiales bacterium]
MEQLISYIVKSLVDNPEKVEITTENESEKVVIVRVVVDPSDLGKVIGKGGKIANSIRTIIKSASAKSGRRFIVKISE